MHRFTDDQLMNWIKQAPAPWSLYIRNQARCAGFFVSADVIRGRLSKLAAAGVLTRSEYPNGYYGFTWTIAEVHHG